MNIVFACAITVALIPVLGWSAGPETDEPWRQLKSAVLTVAVEDTCPTTTARTYAIVADLLTRHDIDLETTDRRINVELNCYQPELTSKPHYALITRFFSSPGSVPSSYRRIGALPEREKIREKFLDYQLERTLQDMLQHHLSQEGSVEARGEMRPSAERALR